MKVLGHESYKKLETVETRMEFYGVKLVWELRWDWDVIWSFVINNLQLVIANWQYTIGNWNKAIDD